MQCCKKTEGIANQGNESRGTRYLIFKDKRDGLYVMIKTVNIANKQLCFIFKLIPGRSLNNLKSQVEVNRDELIEGARDCDYSSVNIVCEGGWYFNKPERIISALPQCNLFYFILNPSITTLRQNYIRRHPRTKKDINNDSHWENYEKTISLPMLNRNNVLKSKLKNSGVPYCEFSDQMQGIKEKIVIQKISEIQESTIFIITGPNASGKSTLMVGVMKKLGALN